MLNKIDAHRFLHQLITHQISIHEFERWLYSHNELEDLLGRDEYLEFVSRDYQSKFAFQETEKQIKNLITVSFFVQERMIVLLNRLIQSDQNFLVIMEKLYDDYCEGLTFLRYIALYFVTTGEEYKESLINDPVKLEQYLAPVKDEAKRLLTFLEKDQLSIIGENEFLDSRTEADRIELHSINEMLAANKKNPDALR
ncbi:hypothetical protein B2K_11485 [Paenibacillus mucilaginosus K02]|uniref:Uncharacterized protein n=1 Tax=Paenibacillus mucilaginosus K02 TaxID=997761 RepID=I0BG36_9BACL|nr:hypothetical protein B2K_11485 [Paenibacillus mucilaginosus K02]